MFLLNACLFLPAQSFVRVSIHVNPVTGEGGGLWDNQFFFSMLEMGVQAHNFLLADGPGEADYSLSGSLSPFDSYSYILRLEMFDNINDRALVEQSLVYRDLEEAHALFASLLYSIFPNVPVERELYQVDGALAEGDGWRNRLLYLGGQLNWAPRVYADTSFSTHFASFGLGFSAELHFSRHLAFGAGAGVVNEWVEVTYMETGENRDVVLELPVSLRLVFRPGDNFMLQPYVGAQFNISLFGVTTPSMISWLGGFQCGARAGPGVFMVDARVMADRYRSRLNRAPQHYDRYLLNVGVGYKFGFWRRG